MGLTRDRRLRVSLVVWPGDTPTRWMEQGHCWRDSCNERSSSTSAAAPQSLTTSVMPLWMRLQLIVDEPSIRINWRAGPFSVEKELFWNWTMTRTARTSHLNRSMRFTNRSQTAWTTSPMRLQRSISRSTEPPPCTPLPAIRISSHLPPHHPESNPYSGNHRLPVGQSFSLKCVRSSLACLGSIASRVYV